MADLCTPFNGFLFGMAVGIGMAVGSFLFGFFAAWRNDRASSQSTAS